MTLTRLAVLSTVIVKNAGGAGNIDFTLYAQEPGGAPVALWTRSSPNTETEYVGQIGAANREWPAGTKFYVDISAWSAGAVAMRLQLHGFADSEVTP